MAKTAVTCSNILDCLIWWWLNKRCHVLRCLTIEIWIFCSSFGLNTNVLSFVAKNKSTVNDVPILLVTTMCLLQYYQFMDNINKTKRQFKLNKWNIFITTDQLLGSWDIIHVYKKPCECLLFSLYRYRADTQTYQPYNKDWIKEKIYVLLRRQAQQAGK